MLTVLLAALLPCAEVDPEPPSVPMKILGQMEFLRRDLIETKGQEARRLVLRSAEDLYKASIVFPQKDDLSAKRASLEVVEVTKKRLQVKAIDWDNQMLVVVTAGEKPSFGYRVEVTGVKVKGGKLTVSWKLHEPNGVAPAATSHPGAVVLVPRYKGKVVFEQVKK